MKTYLVKVGSFYIDVQGNLTSRQGDAMRVQVNLPIGVIDSPRFARLVPKGDITPTLVPVDLPVLDTVASVATHPSHNEPYL